VEFSTDKFDSVSNLGGTFPRYFILKFVDAFTVATCQPPSIPPAKDLLKGDLITQPFSCALEAEKHRCLDGGGACEIQHDGKSCTDTDRVDSMLIMSRRLLHRQYPLRDSGIRDVPDIYKTAGAQAAAVAIACLADSGR